jgi:perosamine synthetase
VYWVFGLLLKRGFGKNALQVMRALAEKGVATRPFFYPLHQQPILKRMGFFKDTQCPQAEFLYQNGFYIPSGLALTEQQIDYVARVVVSELS